MLNTGKSFILVAACLGTLTACGGNDTSSPGQDIHSQARKFLRTDKTTATTASDYQTVVQELYVAYFGRPADPTGLVNFEGALLAANAPTNIQGLNAAYATTPAIQSLVNSFGISVESQTLYGSGNTNAFVTAVFQNVLGRPPQQAGLTFWSNAIGSNLLSQGDAALAIMAGALANTSAQGLLDAQLINNRLAVASYFTSQVSAENAVSVYSGSSAAAGARSLLNGVTASTDTTAYQTTVISAIQVLASVPGIITSVVGMPMNPGFSGDNGPATNASLYFPAAIAADGAGNIFIADHGNNVVRKVAANGVVTAVAGNGSNDYWGDNGPATSAALCYPDGLAVDGAGDIYIVDRNNFRIRKVNGTTGIITTVAGNGTPGYAGDNGPATNAELFYVSAVAVDEAGNIFIGDSANSVIRKVAVNGIITTYAGNGSAGYSGDNGPATSATLNAITGVAVDTAGNLYIGDVSDGVVRKVAPNGIITTMAGNGTPGYAGDNGPATSARLFTPMAVSVDEAGNIYIADYSNNNIRKVNVATGIITTVAGNGTQAYAGDGGPAINADLSAPQGVAVDTSGNLYIADTDNNVIRKVGTNGIITTVAGNGSSGYGNVSEPLTSYATYLAICSFTGDNVPAISATICFPSGVAVDAGENLYIADTNNNRIREVSAATGNITTIAGNGTQGYSGDNEAATSAMLFSPSAIAVDANGNAYIADSRNNVIRKVNATTGIITTVAGNGIAGYSGDNGLATAATLNVPIGVAVDTNGNIYVADANNFIRKVSTTGIITSVAGNGALVHDLNTGDIYCAFSGDNVLATNTALCGPSAVAVDAGGNIYIADTGNNRIRKVNVASNIITTIAGGGSAENGDNGPATSAALAVPAGIAIDTRGNIYFGDKYAPSVRKVDVNGIITTVAGNGSRGFSGDGGLATSAQLFPPLGVAVDLGGNLYIADSYNDVIRKVIGN